MIARLLKRTDYGAALGDAQSWYDVLVAFKTPSTDQRLKDLVQAIPELKKRLQEARPKQETATAFDQCLDALDKMQDAIKALNAAAARAAGLEAERAMKANPEVAKRFAERYEKQKGWLEELAKKPQPATPTKRPEDVEQLLKDALALAQQGKVTEALEARKQALFLAPRVALDANQEKRFTRLVKELTTVAIKARGLRAVVDAERCFKEGDDETLKVLVAEARRDLPEFTKEPAFRTAYNQVEKFAVQPTSKVSGSEFGKGILFRHEYERALDLFREGDNLAGSVEATDRARQRAPDEAARSRAIELSFEGIEAWILTTTASEKDEPRRAASRAALDKVKSWLGEPRWKALDAILRSREAKAP